MGVGSSPAQVKRSDFDYLHSKNKSTPDNKKGEDYYASLVKKRALII